MQNYHCHKSFSNLFTSFKDSSMSYDDYAKRAVELGQEVLSSVEHGWQGNYLRCYQAAKKYGLKFVYGTEAYWVRDRHEADRTNAHIIILAQTLEGIYQINEMLSCANEDGYYAVPRVDPELLRKLNPDDVFITTACVAFWGKLDKETRELRWHYGGDENNSDEMMRLFEELAGYFKSSLALEVQCHNTAWQKQINQLCLKLSKQYHIPLICGLDSHYIYDSQKQERRYLREETGVKSFDEDYEFESGVYEDYPDEETVVQRFREQGVLNEDEIREAIDMTDTICFFEEIEFDTSRKLPNPYPDKTQEERNQMYLDLVHDAWLEYRKTVPQERWAEYEESFYKDEADIVVATNMSDYFLLDHEVVKRGIAKGGMITPSGRGSSGSWFTNSLLGMSTLDRFDLPVPLYPARFCTADRLLTSCPDLDMNLSDPSIFAEAQEEILGKGHSYPMIAYGTLKYKSAFKLYARAQGVPADIANDVSKQIDEYERAVKEAESEEEKETIDIADYVDDAYISYIEESAPYRGIVVSKSQAPCAYMIYDGDIRREVGIMKINADQGKKVVYCTVIDGYTAEDYGYVKNDLLAVKTIAQSAEAMKRAGLPRYTSKQIIQLTKGDKATWDIFAKGYTQGINQCQGTGTTEKLMLYKPQSLQDLSAFVAAIRPGFKSMVNKFLHREKFSYGIPSFDELLHNDSSGSSWLMYQEDIMKCLGLAGFPMDETYPIIKAISKKKLKIIDASKSRFMEGFSKYIVEKECASPADAKDVTERVWKIILDSSSYMFGAAHSVAVAIDALYGAYLKAHYPYEYYSTLLDDYSSMGNKDKVALIKAEMKRSFGINIVPAKFRQDNRSFFVDKEHKQISDALTSVKHVGKPVANELYKMRDMQFDSFIDLLLYMDSKKKVFNARVTRILIMMDYFSEFGSRGKLLTIYNAFRTGAIHYDEKYVDATKAKRLTALRELEANTPDSDLSPEEIISFECAYYGAPISTFPDKARTYVVLDVNTSYSPKLKVYGLPTGKTGTVKVLKKTYAANPIQVGDVIVAKKYEKHPAYTYSNGERKVRPGVEDVWMLNYEITYRKEGDED